MIQGWWTIKVTKATQLLTQELTGEQLRGNLCFTWMKGGRGGVKYKILVFLTMITFLLIGYHESGMVEY